MQPLRKNEAKLTHWSPTTPQAEKNKEQSSV
jgi:hypothetical protein